MQDDEQAQQPQTPGHAAAAAALRQSVEINRREVQLASETIAVLRSEIHLAVSHGIRDAVRAAVHEDNIDDTKRLIEQLFGIAGGLIKSRGKEHAGGWLFGLVWAGAKQAFLFVLFSALIYKVAGASALLSFWSMLGDRS